MVVICSLWVFRDEISPGAVDFKPAGDDFAIKIENGHFSWDDETAPQLQQYESKI